MLTALLILNSLAFANDGMPVAQQNALVQKYCAVCHTDAVRNGGLSLEHFDAAHAAPSLAAMMVSKLRGGALGASGMALPDKATDKALTEALISEAAGADRWAISRTQGQASVSILRELPGATNEGQARLYRLAISCNPATREGTIQLAWAPVPATGTLSVAVDGKAPVAYSVEGRESMGNGSKVTTGPAAILLSRMRNLPNETMTVGGLFPNESVEFPFRDLDAASRGAVASCFSGN